MGKERHVSWAEPASTQKHKRLNLKGHLLVLVSLFIFSVYYFSNYIDLSYFSTSPSSRPQAVAISKDEFTWDSITPKTHLDFVPCFYERDIQFQCAKLDVPMAWTNATNTRRVSLAVIRLPAPVPVTSDNYGGAILINPGGPGGSGVSAAMRFGPDVSTIINSPSSALESGEGKAYDLISWDPRGVNNTTPRLNCFPDSLTADVWRLSGEVEGTSEQAVNSLWARAKALAGACTEDKDPDGMLGHMNTRAVVADMVAIIEALGQFREKTASALLSCPRNRLSTESKAAKLASLSWKKGKEKLLYWGFSYGTLLGATFSAMEPSRVSRVILDGVVDSTDYYSNLWEKDLQDTDAIIDNFYQYCSEAGSSKCALNRGNDTAEDIKNVLEGLVDALKEDPMPVWGAEGPEIITYSDVMGLIFQAVYTPLEAFPLMAMLLADVAYGNGSTFAAVKKAGHEPSCPLSCDKNSKSKSTCDKELASEGQMGILCSDGPDVSKRTKQWYVEDRERLIGQSKWLGEHWSMIPLSCVRWKGRPKWSVAPDDIKGNTSHPILWVGNTFDPVTPLANAHKMAKKFPGSVVLQQNSEGHCCISSPSLCTAKYIRAYIQTGELPPPGTACDVEEKPLLGKSEEKVKAYTIEDVKVLEAMSNINLGARRNGPLPLSPF